MVDNDLRNKIPRKEQQQTVKKKKTVVSHRQSQQPNVVHLFVNYKCNVLDPIAYLANMCVYNKKYH